MNLDQLKSWVEQTETDLESAMHLIRTLKISDDMRVYLMTQSATYAAFLTDYQHGALNANDMPGMLSLINEFCSLLQEQNKSAEPCEI